MDAINPEFSTTDVVVVVGANDVVNLASTSAKGTPIYGMPILNVHEAGTCIVCNIDVKPGYSGVPNPLYERDNVLLVIGDAKETIGALVEEL